MTDPALSNAINCFANRHPELTQPVREEIANLLASSDLSTNEIIVALYDYDRDLASMPHKGRRDDQPERLTLAS